MTQIAGRGIGLDVVREADSRLRGEVSHSNGQQGLGTTLEIVVPVSLAAVEALIVEAGGRPVAIPLDAVKRTLRVSAGDLAQSAQGTSILFEGRVIPFAPLERTLRRGVQSKESARSWSAVIIEGATRWLPWASIACAARKTWSCGRSQSLRPAIRSWPAHRSMPRDIRNSCSTPQPWSSTSAVLGPANAAEAPLRAPILVIDDSLTTRMLEQSILESAGYEVDLATSGEDGARPGAQAFAMRCFWWMSRCPGWMASHSSNGSRADPLLREIPAMLVTSRASGRRPAIADRSVGAHAYIVKGEFDQTELLEKIRSLVGAQ